MSAAQLLANVVVICVMTIDVHSNFGWIGNRGCLALQKDDEEIILGHDSIKGSRKKFKIIIVSKKVNGFRRHVYNFWKVSEDTYLHFGPSQIAPLSQKLVFKA